MWHAMSPPNNNMLPPPPPPTTQQSTPGPPPPPPPPPPPSQSSNPDVYVHHNYAQPPPPPQPTYNYSSSQPQMMGVPYPMPMPMQTPAPQPIYLPMPMGGGGGGGGCGCCHNSHHHCQCSNQQQQQQTPQPRVQTPTPPQNPQYIYVQRDGGGDDNNKTTTSNTKSNNDNTNGGSNTASTTNDNSNRGGDDNSNSKPKSQKFSKFSVASLIIFICALIMGTTCTVLTYQANDERLEGYEQANEAMVVLPENNTRYMYTRKLALSTGCAAAGCFTIATLLSFYAGLRHNTYSVKHHTNKKKQHCCLAGFVISGWIIFCLTFLNNLIVAVLAFDITNVIYPEVVFAGLIGNLISWLLMFGYSELARRAG